MVAACGVVGSLTRPARIGLESVAYRFAGKTTLASVREGSNPAIAPCVHCVCQRMAQPIRLILPDLFQDRLAHLTEHAAHVDMVTGAVAQHGLRVAPITQRLQGQAVRWRACPPC
jgi:hypothetical protein